MTSWLQRYTANAAMVAATALGIPSGYAAAWVIQTNSGDALVSLIGAFMILFQCVAFGLLRVSGADAPPRALAAIVGLTIAVTLLLVIL
jgi:hypothetical protein